MRVLITNLTLGSRTGTELYVRDLALCLLRRGHEPVAYTAMPGTVADDLRDNGVTVVDDVFSLSSAPDVIHGHHTIETLTAMLRFPATPAVFVCHSWIAWFDAPPQHRHIRRYVAVSQACRDRLVGQHGVPDDRVRMILNAVDTERFRPREPLPARPRRAVVFSSNAHDGAYLEAVRQACDRTGLELDFLGAGMLGRDAVTARPEEELGKYDLVFGKGRCALEGMAVGAAVVVCDAVGLGGMVTTENLERFRQLNFGFSAMDREATAEAIEAEIARYEAREANAVSRLVRANAGIESQVDALLGVYDEAVAEHAGCPPCPDEDRSAAAALLRTLSSRVWVIEGLSNRLVAERDAALAEQARVAHEHARVAAENEQLAAAAHALGEQAGALGAEGARLRAELERQQEALLELRRTATFRLRAALLRMPGVARAVRALRAIASRRRGSLLRRGSAKPAAKRPRR